MSQIGSTEREVAVVIHRISRIGAHVVQPMKQRIDEQLVDHRPEADAHIGVREILDQPAHEDEHRVLAGRHADEQPDAAEDDGLEHIIEHMVAIIRPAVHLPLAVVEAVQRPPPGKGVLQAVNDVLGEIEDREIKREEQDRLVAEPG